MESQGKVERAGIRERVLGCFNDIQQGSGYKQCARQLLRCTAESLEETTSALNQVLLQLFIWRKKSKKLATIYRLLRAYLQEGLQAMPTSTQEPCAPAVSPESIRELGKELLLLCCSACASTSYLTQLRASTSMRSLYSPHLLGIILESCGQELVTGDDEALKKLESACLLLLRSKACLKETAIKLAPLFEREGSKHSSWTWELLRIMGTCKTVEYRKAAIENIVLSKFTLPYVLQKVRDVKDTVRAAVFAKLQKDKVMLHKLSLAARLELVYNGLSDRSDLVRNSCAAFLQDWVQAQDLEVHKKSSGASLSPGPSAFEPDEHTRRQTRLPLPPLQSATKSQSQSQVEEQRKKHPLDKALKLLELFDVARLKNDEVFCICLDLLVKFIVDHHDPADLIDYFKTVVLPGLRELRCGESKGPRAKRQSGEPQANKEGLLLLRMTGEYMNENKEKYGSVVHELEDCLPRLEEMHEIVRECVRRKDLFATHELLLLFPCYNCMEPIVNQRLLTILEEILNNLHLDKEDNPEKFTQESALDTKTDSKVKLSKEYAQLVQDQLDLQRRDVVVRRMEDLIPVSMRILRRLMTDESNQYSVFVRMRIADLQERMDDAIKQTDAHVIRLDDSEGESRLTLQREVDRLQLEESLCLMRALKLAVCLLQTCKVSKTDVWVAEVQASLVKTAFERHSDNELVNFLATQFLGLYALIDQDKCVELFGFFKQLITGINSTPTLKSIAALKSLFDFYIAHGHILLKAPAQAQGPNALQSLRELQMLLYSPNPRIRLLVYENFAKLLFCDKLPRAEAFMLPLMLLLGDTSEAPDEVGAMKQMVTLAFKHYPKLSLKRCKHLSRAIVLLTLLWSKASREEAELSSMCLLYKFTRFQYPVVTTHLVYILTSTYLATDSFVDLRANRDNFVAEIIVLVLKLIATTEDGLAFLQRLLNICLRFIDLVTIRPALLVALYTHWQRFMQSVSKREKEYYSFTTSLRLQLAKMSEVDSNTGQAVVPDDIKDEDIARTVEAVKEAAANESDRLQHTLTKLSHQADMLAEEYEQLQVDHENGSIDSKEEEADSRYSSPTTLPPTKSCRLPQSRRSSQRFKLSSLEFETPKANTLRKRRRALVNTIDELVHNSKMPKLGE